MLGNANVFPSTTTMRFRWLVLSFMKAYTQAYTPDQAELKTDDWAVPKLGPAASTPS